jgi:hypothetical protein
MCGNEHFRFNYRIKGEERTITKCYRLTAITLRLQYISALLHNAIGGGEKSLLLEVIFGHREAVIATHSYRSGNILAVIASKSYCFDSQTKAITCNAVTYILK